MYLDYKIHVEWNVIHKHTDGLVKECGNSGPAVVVYWAIDIIINELIGPWEIWMEF